MIDGALVVSHAVFCAVFAASVVIGRRRQSPPSVAPAATELRTAPWSRLYVAIHGVAFWLLYIGVALAFGHSRAHPYPLGQRVAGTLTILTGAVIAASAASVFASWRFRAQLTPGHVLVTEGLFRLVRHPIYLGLDLLALGTAIWLQGAVPWAAFVIMCVGGDLRARAEERLLLQTFGATYADYVARTRRFVPRLY